MRRIFTFILGLCLILITISAQGANFSVTNLNDSGPGSLRQAFQDAEANGDSEQDIISIDIAGTINLTTANSPGFNLLPNLNNVSIIGHSSGTTLRRDPSVFGRFFQITSSQISGIVFDGGNSILTGGALFVSGTSVIESCTFLNNVAGSNAHPGGDNTGFGSGGAIRVNGSDAVLTLNDCTFTENRAQNGAAIRIFPGATINLNNCTFSGNIVDNGGNDGTQSTIYNQGTANLVGNVIANTVPEGTPDLYDVGTTIEININNLVEICNGPGCTTGGAASGFAFTQDPQLGPLQNNGQGIPTFAILPSSPLIDFNIGTFPVGTEVMQNEGDLVKDLPVMGQWNKAFLILILLGSSLFLLLSRKNNF
ncbi:MAG: hypothetical protein Sapg2KO_36080 [Saprospiraceae bacterium]